MRKFLTLTAAAALAVALGFAGTAQAASISIDNDDFDTQVLGENGATLGVITDWTVSVAGNGGLFNPTADEYSVDHTTIGNVAWSRDGSVISQVLTGETLTAGTKYTLTAKVGFRNDNSPPPFPGYKVQLWAGGTLLVEDDNSTPPAADTFITSTVMYQAFGNDPNLGDTLEIRLQSKSGSGQAHFNDITLDAVVPSCVNGETHLNVTAAKPFPEGTWISVIPSRMTEKNDEGLVTARYSPIGDSLRVNVDEAGATEPGGTSSGKDTLEFSLPRSLTEVLTEPGYDVLLVTAWARGDGVRISSVTTLLELAEAEEERAEADRQLREVLKNLGLSLSTPSMQESP